MDLESLKAAMDAALAASQAAPADKDLQKKHAEAKKAYDDAVAEAKKKEDEGDGGGGDDFDEAKADEKTKAYLAKLRKENAGHRTKAKDLASQLKTSEDQKKAILKAAGIEDDSETPEEKLKVLSVESQQLAFRSAILESAVQHGIGKDDLEFFEFLVAKSVESLEEGEELTEEQMTEIVTKVKKGSKTPANSSVGNGGGGKGAPNPNPNPTEVTLEKFIRMSITEKSKLYETNVELYTSLMTQARAQKKLV